MQSCLFDNTMATLRWTDIARLAQKHAFEQVSVINLASYLRGAYNVPSFN
jgi:hypothetical protein